LSQDLITGDVSATPLALPVDRPRRRTAPVCSATERMGIPAHTAELLDELAAAEGSTREAVLHAAFVALLHRYTGQEEFAVTVTDGTVRTSVPGDATLRDLVGRAGSGQPVSGPSAVAFRTDAGEHGPYELLLDVSGPDRLELHYDAALFDTGTARRMLNHYLTLLGAGLADPAHPVALLPLLPPQEQHEMLVRWNATATDLPHDVCLHRAFEARAAEAPDSAALFHATGSVSFGQLNSAANRLAHHLRSLGIGPESRVGLCLDRSPELVVAVLAVLKSGGAYVPLDPDYPAERLAGMVAGAECTVMISRSDLTANLATTVELILLDRDADLIAQRPDGDPEGGAGPDDLCYVIYTSGSTGVPKPIALRHRGVANNLADLNSRYGVGPADRALGLSSPSFDMSVYEILGMTTAGGAVVLPSPDRAKDPAHWAELIVRHGITVWNSAPALLNLLTTHVEESGCRPLPSLRLAMLGGDWIPVTLADRVRAYAPELRFIALGGATESSIHSTLFEVVATDPAWTSVPYGAPMANQRTYILDEARRPVPIGVPGDLHLAGIGLAREYLGQPERTAERFTDWSYGPVTGERLYRTGDLARYRPDGVIELLGRLDFQVKIRGLRIELGEVEAVLRRHPAVREAVVAARTDAAGDRVLVGYAVARDGVALDPRKLKEYLADVLPSYMVPSVVLVLDALPLSANGKLDRRALPAPGPMTDGTDSDAPFDEYEQRVAQVWQEVLGIERIGRDSHFFALGGDSMKAIRSMPRISPALKWADLYRNPTLKDLAAHLRTISTA
jgi:amino acid adenylation domain-containing protein